jgi:microcystin-dependent protein
MALIGVPISEDQCMGDSLPIINNALETLDACCQTNSNSIETLKELVGTTDLTSYIPKPAAPVEKDLLAFNAASNTWQSKSVYEAILTILGNGLQANSNTKQIEAIIPQIQIPEIPDLSSQLVPTGAIVMFPSLTIPNGWAKCTGQQLSKEDNPGLFDVIGYAYGGSGNNFNVPDLRGLFVRGLDEGKGIDPNRSLGTTQEDSIKSHTHGCNGGGGNEGGPFIDSTSAIDYQTVQTLAFGGAETRPKNIALVYCIKL